MSTISPATVTKQNAVDYVVAPANMNNLNVSLANTTVISQSQFTNRTANLSPVINAFPVNSIPTGNPQHINTTVNPAHLCINISHAASGVIGIATAAPTNTPPNCTKTTSDHIQSRKRMSLRKGEKGMVHGWLEAMKESSPPRSRPTAAVFKDTFISKVTDFRHQRTRISKLPSALDNFDQIIEAATGKRVAVFLDYDGTLSPIVEDPDRAFMSDEMRAIVKEVASVFPTAIISGRSREKIREFIKLPELYYAGSHGMDIMGPKDAVGHPAVVGAQGRELVCFQPGNEFLVPINEVFKLLEDKTKDIPGARVEHNKFCVTVHFRCVKEKNWVALAEQVHQVVQSYPNLRLTEGRKILEIRPLITWNKGKALDYLLKALGLADQSNVFPIYIGDDRSDEDAFKVLNRKKHGLSILVTSTPKATNAVCSLTDPVEVGELLLRLVRWKRRRLNKFP